MQHGGSVGSVSSRQPSSSKATWRLRGTPSRKRSKAPDRRAFNWPTAESGSAGVDQAKTVIVTIAIEAAPVQDANSHRSAIIPQGSYWRVLPRCGWCWRRWVFGAPRDGVDSTIIGSGASSWWSSRHHSPHGGEPVSVVARAESHLLAVEVDAAVVGDGALVGAAPEVSDDIGGAGERRFSILPIISSSRCATRTIRYSDKRPLCFARRPTTVSSAHKDGSTSNLPNVGDARQHATSLSFVACQRRPRFRKTDKFPNPVRLLRWGAAMMVDVCSAWNASGASGPP